ncbi:MAG: gamma-glutamyl-gamma-aminobutyrate hydrolase family protein, partial [Bacteroidales bacterium]|nr:gamma-glutamyl-gamma-aminobutyrate hydrolase family protein [Bacteroidales bacterium]
MRRSCLILALLALVLVGCKSGKPVVGISSSWDDCLVVSVNDSYVRAVREAGGIPLVLPAVRSEAEAGELLDMVDALILTGGEDVAPWRYGEEVLNESVEVNAPRDSSDFLLASLALSRGLPLMGICRGEQLLNVLAGGSLYQDLPSQVGSLPDGARDSCEADGAAAGCGAVGACATSGAAGCGAR